MCAGGEFHPGKQHLSACVYHLHYLLSPGEGNVNGRHMRFQTILECADREPGNNSIDAATKNCIYYDKQLFQGKLPPTEWRTFMETVRTLQTEEEAYYSLSQANTQYWYQIQTDEENENGRAYDFVQNPALLGHIGSLLLQLKLFT